MVLPNTVNVFQDDYNRFKTQEFRGYYRPNPKHFQWDDTLQYVFLAGGNDFIFGFQLLWIW